MIKAVNTIILLALAGTLFCQYAPAAGLPGTTAIAKDSNSFVNWANTVSNFNPGPENISDSQSPLASFGVESNALGLAEGNSANVVSLGDGGTIILSFQHPIMNGAGPDFAVFENSITDTFLEFAFVEVSTNGIDYVRFPAISTIPTVNQTGAFGNSEPTLVYNLAGKYRQGYGTPFDLEELIDSSALNLDSINYVRIVDVIGSIDPAIGSSDMNGSMINDPFPTPFYSSGFDIDAIGVINQNYLLSNDTYSQLVVTIYPNPACEAFTIKTNDNSSDFKIYNTQGQLISKGKCNVLVYTELLTNGIYFVTVFSKDVAESYPLMVFH